MATWRQIFIQREVTNRLLAALVWTPPLRKRRDKTCCRTCGRVLIARASLEIGKCWVCRGYWE